MSQKLNYVNGDSETVEKIGHHLILNELRLLISVSDSVSLCRNIMHTWKMMKT